MARHETDLRDVLSQRDGTSQRDRSVLLLDPRSVPVDERSDADLVLFVQKLTQHLILSSSNDVSGESMPGNWQAFATPPSELSLSPPQIAAFIDQPENVSGDAARWLGRPHFALLLVCIALLRQIREQQNGLVRKHLDHYYRTQLAMTPQPARPDRVAVLVHPARGQDAVLLPAGTKLRAGKDRLGVARIYLTDEDLVIRTSRVDDVRTVAVNRRISSLSQLRRAPLRSQPQKDLFDQGLRLALGEPGPGDEVPKMEGNNIDVGFLAGLQDLLNKCWKTLYLTHGELRELVVLHGRRTDQGSDREWIAINRLIDGTAKEDSSRDFMGKLQQRIGKLDFSGDGLSKVNSVQDLYTYRDDQDVRSYIDKRLSALSYGGLSGYDVFVKLMSIKQFIDADWQQIHRLLERAGRRKRPQDLAWRLPPLEDPPNLVAMLEKAIGEPGGLIDSSQSQQDGLSRLLTYDTSLRELEAHFYMPVERLQLLVQGAKTMASVGAELLPQATWERLLEILASAHQERFHANRRRSLEKAVENQAESIDKLTQLLVHILNGAGLNPPALDTTWNWDTGNTELAHWLQPSQLAVLQVYRQQLEQPGVLPRRFVWADVLRVLEFAQCRIANLAEPEARRSEWRSLVTNADPRGSSQPGGVWPPFGSISRGSKEHPPEPNVGFALASPMLQLSQGERTLILTLGFAQEGFNRDVFLKQITVNGSTLNARSIQNRLTASLIIRVSAADGWIDLQIEAAKLDDATQLGNGYWTLVSINPPTGAQPRPALQLTLKAPSSAPSFLPAEGMAFPMLQVLLRPIWDGSSQEWITTGAFEPLRLEAAHLKVAVNGLRDLKLQQDDRRLDARKPFQPFGPQPVVGSRLYLSHPEIIRLPLDSITFQLEWTGLTKKLEEQYRNYPKPIPNSQGSTGISGNDFTIQASLIGHRQDVRNGQRTSNLFGDTNNQGAAQIKLSSKAEDFKTDSSLIPGADLRQDSRVWCWTLTPLDFGHSIYPGLAAAKARELAIALATSGTSSVKAEAYEVDPPYTPTLKRLTVDYETSMEFLPQTQAAGSELLHVHPYGVEAMLPETATNPAASLLPPYPSAGELYIGLSDTTLPQRLNLWLQVAEGSSDPDLTAGRLRWQILDGPRWRDLSVRLDDTAGFLNSGLVILDLPQVSPGRQLPAGLCWLRVTIDRDRSSVCDAINLHSQAVMATFQDEGNDPEHCSTPLPAGSITGLVVPKAGIGPVIQPYPSWSGRVQEAEADLDRRVSESLRHKGRALAAWDYERLVLEEFGRTIHKVKCLRGNGLGEVVMIVIPELRSALPADALAPKAPANVLAAIQAYLQARTPESAKVRVRNATFQPVRIRLGVRFREGLDEPFCRQRLNQDLVRYLSPWAYSEASEVRFGNTIFATSIVDFTDRLDYVDYVGKISMALLDPDGMPTSKPADGLTARIQAPSPSVVLVSAVEHQFDQINDRAVNLPSFSGIGYMQIGFDFVIASPLSQEARASPLAQP